MNLICEDRNKVSLMTAFYFIGFGVGIFLFPLPDKFGRFKVLGVSMFGYIIAIACLLWIPTITVRSVCLFLIGFFHLKNSQAYVICFECVEDRHKPAVSTAINAFDGSTLIFLGTYFIFIKDWFPYQLFMFVVQCISLVLFFLFVQESPKWLLIQGRKADAIKSFNRIARINGHAN